MLGKHSKSDEGGILPSLENIHCLGASVQRTNAEEVTALIAAALHNASQSNNIKDQVAARDALILRITDRN